MSKARKTAASSGEPDFWRVARDWLHHWLPKVRGSSPKTVEAYRIGLESYVRWLETTEGTQRSHIGFGHFDRARLGRWVEWIVLLQCLFDRFGSVFPQCGLMVFPGVVIVSR